MLASREKIANRLCWASVVRASVHVSRREVLMNRFGVVTTLLVVSLALPFAQSLQGQHEHPAGDPEKLGKVNFPVSCDAALQPQFNDAVAMLHSFWYEKAADAFAATAEK